VNWQTRETGSIGTRLRMVKPETHAVLRQDTWWINQRHRQYCDKTQNLCPFSLACPNTACVSGLSIHSVLSKYCLCLWLFYSVYIEWTNQKHRQYWDKTEWIDKPDNGSIETRHREWTNHTQALLRQDTEWTNHRHRHLILTVSLVYPSCVLSQYCMCLWFDHSESCLNASSVSDLSIMCLVPILPVSLVCPFCVLSQWCTGSIETRHRMDKPET
jgi:hypothetical protein